VEQPLLAVTPLVAMAVILNLAPSQLLLVVVRVAEHLLVADLLLAVRVVVLGINQLAVDLELLVRVIMEVTALMTV
jgi:hypothetical protein